MTPEKECFIKSLCKDTADIVASFLNFNEQSCFRITCAQFRNLKKYEYTDEEYLLSLSDHFVGVNLWSRMDWLIERLIESSKYTNLTAKFLFTCQNQRKITSRAYRDIARYLIASPVMDTELECLLDLSPSDWFAIQTNMIVDAFVKNVDFFSKGMRRFCGAIYLIKRFAPHCELKFWKKLIALEEKGAFPEFSVLDLQVSCGEQNFDYNDRDFDYEEYISYIHRTMEDGKPAIAFLSAKDLRID